MYARGVRELAFAAVFLAPALAFGAGPECADAAVKTRVAEARKAYGQGRFEEAIAGYEAAYACKPDPGHLFNIANARAERKQWAEAARVMERFLASPGVAEEVRAEAKKTLDDLLSRVGKLSVTSEVAGADVELGGKIVGKAPLQGWLVDAGTVEVRVIASGKPPFQQRVELGAGKALTVAARWSAEGPPPPPPAPPGRQPAWWSWVGFGAAGALAVVGGVTGGLSLAKTDEVKKLCTNGSCPPSTDGARDEANALANAANVTLPLAGAALIVGVVGVIVGEPTKPKDPRAARVRWRAPLALEGSF